MTRTPTQAPAAEVTSRMDRHNGLIYGASTLLIYLAAPVFYVDIVQAGLLSRLGASRTIANLPASAYLLGGLAPILLASAIRRRAERSVLVVVFTLAALLLGLVSSTLILPAPTGVRIAAIILQGLVLGPLIVTAGVYRWQCLARGTSAEGRARALQWTFSVGPAAAVAGSLGAQYLLGSGSRVRILAYPYDYAALYLFGAACSGAIAILLSRFDLPPAEDEPRQAMIPWLRTGIGAFCSNRYLVTLFAGYFLLHCTLGASSNFSLATEQAMGVAPKQLSGIIMAMRFGLKAVAGFALGAAAIRFGVRMPVLTTISLAGIAALWAYGITGAAFLLAFGIMGAGELGGVYFPNYAVSLSSTAARARNIAILEIAGPLSAVVPALHGMLTDHFGFRASFLLGIATALVGVWLVLRLPQRVQGSAD